MSDSDDERRLCPFGSVALVEVFEGSVRPCPNYMGSGDYNLERDY